MSFAGNAVDACAVAPNTLNNLQIPEQKEDTITSALGALGAARSLPSSPAPLSASPADGTPLLTKSQVAEIATQAWNQSMAALSKQWAEKNVSPEEQARAQRLLTDLKTHGGAFAALLQDLQCTTGNQQAFVEQMQKFMDAAAPHAFNQHYYDPQHLVSHDFWHGLAVAQATQEALDGNESVVAGLQFRQLLSPNTAKVATIMTAAFHDVGYPEQDSSGWNKASHAPISAEVFGRIYLP